MWLIPRSLNSALASACLAKGFPLDCEPSDDDLVFWVTSSAMPTQRPSSWRGWKHRRWSRHLFGPETLRRFDGSNLLAPWTSSAQASRASRTPWPALAKAPTTPVGYGQPLRTAFAQLSQNSSCWRTYPASDLLGDSPLYSQTWPRSGSVLNGIASEHPTWAPATSASEYSSWQSPQTSDMNGSRLPDGKRSLGLNTKTSAWATPRLQHQQLQQRKMGPNIREQAANWPTPDVCSASRDMSKINPERQKTANGKVTIGLPTVAKNWPTPSASVVNDGESPETWLARAETLKEKHGNGNGAGMPLTVAASAWPTPASRDQKGENSMEHMISGGGRISHIDQLPNFVMYHFSHHDQTITDGQTSSPSTPTLRRQLNATFVDWLMGWPPGYTSTEPTDCAAEEMASWRCKLDSHLSALLGEPALHK